MTSVFTGCAGDVGARVAGLDIAPIPDLVARERVRRDECP